jgi:hypothetical protein
MRFAAYFCFKDMLLEADAALTAGELIQEVLTPRLLQHKP